MIKSYLFSRKQGVESALSTSINRLFGEFPFSSVEPGCWACEVMEKTIKILFIDREHGEFLLIADILSQVRSVNYELVWCDQLETAGG